MSMRVEYNPADNAALCSRCQTQAAVQNRLLRLVRVRLHD